MSNNRIANVVGLLVKNKQQDSNEQSINTTICNGEVKRTEYVRRNKMKILNLPSLQLSLFEAL